MVLSLRFDISAGGVWFLDIRESISDAVASELVDGTQEWMLSAACGGIDPLEADREQMEALCSSCPVFEECAEYSLPLIRRFGNRSGVVFAGVRALGARTPDAVNSEDAP